VAVAAGLVETGRLTLRSHATDGTSDTRESGETGESANGERNSRGDGSGTTTPVFAGPETTFVPLVIGESATVVAARDEEFDPRVYENCRACWADASPFALRTPSLATVRERLAEEIGPEVREEFDAAVATVERDCDPTAFDPVIVTLLLGARHEQFHYDVSRLGADLGLASKATFSRKKTRLEEMGVVTTEKDRPGGGRPRQRLFLTDEYRDRLADGGLSGIVPNVLE
jgi:hypothetical protein